MGPRTAVLEDDEEEVSQQPLEFKGPAPEARTLQCPNCPFQDSSLDAFGKHIERHRPAGFPVYSKKGKLISEICPKGCRRYFNRSKDAETMSAQGVNNLLRELPFHISSCNGSPRLPTSMEEEDMAKKARSVKRTKPAEKAPESRAHLVPGCPVCPEEEFQNLWARGAHLRSKHPGWQKDPRFAPPGAPLARPPAKGNETTQPVPPTAVPMAPEIPVRQPKEESSSRDAGPKAKEKAKALISEMREDAKKMRAEVIVLTDSAEDLEATAEAMEKALE